MTITGRAAVRPRRAAMRPWRTATRRWRTATRTWRTATGPGDRSPLTDGFVALGLLVLVAGTFLPWLRSGTTTRNSYSADGAIKRLVAPHGVTAAVLTTWPLLCLLVAVSLAALLAGFGRTGAGLAAGGAAASGVVCVRVLLAGSNAVLGVAPLGPAITLIGSVAVLATVTVSLVHAVLRRAAPSHRSRRIR